MVVLLIVAVIGAGTIGSAVARNLARSSRGDHVIATDVRVELLEDLKKVGVDVTIDNRRAAKEADVIILCVKPRDARYVIEEIRSEVKDKLVISVAAAISLKLLRKAAPEARLVRAMPNLAVLVQESFTAYCASPEVTGEDKVVAERLLGMLGKVVEIDETQMDAITALSGCSPAYLSVVIEALVRAGVGVGLPKDLALAASAQTMIGTGRLILDAQKEPSEIRAVVATPGGVTEEGLKEMSKYPVEQAFISAVKVGIEKSKSITEGLAEKETSMK